MIRLIETIINFVASIAMIFLVPLCIVRSCAFRKKAQPPDVHTVPRANECDLAWQFLPEARRIEILEYWRLRYTASARGTDIFGEHKRIAVRLNQIDERLGRPMSEPYRLRLALERLRLKGLLTADAGNDNLQQGVTIDPAA